MNHPENILIDLVFILSHCLVCLFNFQIFGKKIFHPAVLFSLVWFGVILMHFLFKFTLLNELYPLSSQTYLVFFIGTVCFTVGSLIIEFLVRSNKNELQKVTNNNSPSFKLGIQSRLFFLALAIIGLPFYIQAAYKIAIASGIDNFFVGLRTELSYGDEDIGPTKYLVSLSAVLYAVNLFAYLKETTKLNRAVLIITFLTTILYAVFATGRLFFFIILSVYLGMNFLNKKGFSVRKYALILFLFLLFFMGYGIYYGKGGDTENTFKENAATASEALGVYLVSSLSAFNQQMEGHIEATQLGDNTLRFFKKIAQQLNLAAPKKLNDLNPEFVYVPYPTNVFTFYSAYIGDFGRLYAWSMLFIFGSLHTWLFIKAIQTRKFRYGFYYSMLLFPLMVSFFSDMYLTILSTWIQVAFFMELLLLADKFFKKTYVRYSNN